MFLALVGFANSRVSEDTKQVLSSFMYVTISLMEKLTDLTEFSSHVLGFQFLLLSSLICKILHQ